MKKKAIITLIALITAGIFISSCNSSHVSPAAITSALGTVGCQTGAVNYAPADAFLNYPGQGIVINSQAEYDAAYIGTAAQPFVDFTTKTLIGMRIGWNCGTSAGMTGISTDCSAVYLEMFRTTSCSMYTCNSFFSYSVAFTIDKTSMPVNVKTGTRQCDGSIITDVRLLQ